MCHTKSLGVFHFFPFLFLPLFFAIPRARFWNVKNFNVHLYVRGIVGDRCQRLHEYLSYEYIDIYIYTRRTIPSMHLIANERDSLRIEKFRYIFGLDGINVTMLEIKNTMKSYVNLNLIPLF